MGKTLRVSATRAVRVAALCLAGGLTLAGGVWAQGPDGAAMGASSGGTVRGTGLALPPAAPLDTKIFPLSEVKRGLRGVAYTVFEGVVPEPMEVEILGVLKDSLGPGQDMILARLHGTKPE